VPGVAAAVSGERSSVTVGVVCSWDEPELLDRIRAVDERVEVVFEPDLVGAPQFAGDKTGDPDFVRTPAQEQRWLDLIARSEVLFGIPDGFGPGLRLALDQPAVRWIHGLWAGVAEIVSEAEIPTSELERVKITSSAGVHAIPLAELTILGLLSFAKDAPRWSVDKAQRRWRRYAVSELDGKTLCILGLGAIGAEIARLASAFGMHTIGIRRRPELASPGVDEVHPPDRLLDVLARADALAIAAPATEQTRGMIGPEELRALKPGAVLVNVGRGSIIQEDALIEALRSGHLAGALLDVVATEPLPPDSELWSLDSVIITSHHGGASDRENERIIELFCDNLTRYLAGEPLINRIV
jgi:phosphoglycerate dehydrogenase-like enzyme